MRKDPVTLNLKDAVKHYLEARWEKDEKAFHSWIRRTGVCSETIARWRKGTQIPSLDSIDRFLVAVAKDFVTSVDSGTTVGRKEIHAEASMIKREVFCPEFVEFIATLSEELKEERFQKDKAFMALFNARLGDLVGTPRDKLTEK